MQIYMYQDLNLTTDCSATKEWPQSNVSIKLGHTKTTNTRFTNEQLIFFPRQFGLQRLQGTLLIDDVITFTSIII